MSLIAYIAYLTTIYLLNTKGHLAYLWDIGGNECTSSSLVLRFFLASAPRCLAIASQRIAKNPTTETIEIRLPMLATAFQEKKASG